MEPIRVLQVVPNMHRAGLETLIMNIYRNIDRQKVQFDFLVHYGQRFDYDDEIERLGGQIYRLTVREDNNFFKYLIDLDRFFSSHPEYKIVHGHMESFGFIYSHYAKKHSAETVIAHSHNAFVEPTLKGFMKNMMNRPWKRTATDLFACSEKAGKFMFGDKPFRVINNGVETERFAYDAKTRSLLRNEMGLEDKTVIGHVGRFDPQKNHDFLLEIFSEYLKLDKKAVLLLVGDGPLFDKIMEKAKALGISDSVRFLGVRSDVDKLYQVFDILMLPSLFEGLPVVGVEAQCAGLPMLTSDEVTAEVEITDLVCRFPLSASADEWAMKISEMITEERVSHHREVAEKGYDIKNTAEFLQQFYIDRT